MSDVFDKSLKAIANHQGHWRTIPHHYTNGSELKIVFNFRIKLILVLAGGFRRVLKIHLWRVWRWAAKYSKLPEGAHSQAKEVEEICWKSHEWTNKCPEDNRIKLWECRDAWGGFYWSHW